jgi:hypothetical protein
VQKRCNICGLSSRTQKQRRRCKRLHPNGILLKDTNDYEQRIAQSKAHGKKRKKATPPKKKTKNKKIKKKIAKPHKKKRKGERTTSLGERWLTYQEYLCTKWWRERRARSILLGGGKCNRCHSTSNLQVHHKTYKRIGQELDEDLEVLCRTCHEIHHGIRPAEPYVEAVPPGETFREIGW